MPRTPRHRPARRALVLLLVAGSVAVAGCKGGGKNAQNAPAPSGPAAPVNTSLAALASGQASNQTSAITDRPALPKPAAAKKDWTQDPALDLQNLLKQLEAEKAKQAAKPAPAEPSQPESPASTQASAEPTAEPASEPTTTATTESASQPEAEPTTEPAAPEVITNPVAPTDPLEVQIAKTSVSLVDLIRRQSLESPAPFQSYIALAMLEALQPGAVQQIITASTTSASPLSPEEQRVIDALTAFGRGAHNLASYASSLELFKRLADMSRHVENVLQLRIANVALATRVTSFGRFSPLPENRFVQGRSIRVLIYTEIEHFAYRPISEAEALSWSQQPGSAVEPGDRFAVEVSQELQLFAASGEQVWAQPEQSVVETSRNQRRDFFLTNDVTFPAILTPGQYSLKVIMRDKTSGVADEAIIPIEVVAEGMLATAPGQ